MYLLYIIRNYLLFFFLSTFIYFSETVKIGRNRLTESIFHYEPLEYRTDRLISDHRIIRKSLDNNVLHLNFKALDRTFNLRLKRDNSLFTHDLHIEDGYNFHPSNIYEGYLQNEPTSFVHGFIYDGIFEGRIHTKDGNEYHVESAKQYKDTIRNDTIHSIIYDVKDISYHNGPYHCGGVKANSEFKNETKFLWSNIKKDEAISESNMHLHNRLRRAINKIDKKGKKTECHLYVRADPTYREWANKDDNRAMYLMSQHVKKVSYIFKKTDFNNDGSSDDYTLHIRRIGIIDVTNCGKDKSPKKDCLFEPKNIGVEKFLDIASLDDHHEYCLSYVFAHRDFSDGVLGLAWIGDVDGAGGICDGFQSIRGIMKSLNTGIVSNLNYGKTVPSRVTDVTLAHEIGHNFGAQHDPTSGTCAPGGDSGNFIMYPRATSGLETNNNKFSHCSIITIGEVLNVKSERCFKEKGEPVCGNRIVEKGEECDCGYHTEPSCITDKCCVGASANGVSKGGCKYTEDAVTAGDKRCSPSQGFCCNVEECKPYSNSSKKECSATGECAQASQCLDTSFQCPKAEFKPNNTVCNTGSNTCVKGECSGSLCSIIGKKDCQCLEKDNFCKVCCQSKSEVGTANCTLYHDKINKKSVNRPPGSPCEQYQGYCDILYKCRKVDAEGPLSRLKKWLSNPKSFSTILDWMKSRWWACVLIGLGLVLLMAGFIACCSVHTPSSNPAKPQHRTLTQTLSRRGRPRNARPTAPTPSTSSGGYQDLPPGYDTAVREHRRVAHEFEMR